jgi:hypothetical protein
MADDLQHAVKALVALGPLPAAEDATVSVIAAFEEHLAKVSTPVTDQEAAQLAKLFGPDECFGLAWTLLHLIETSPSPLAESHFVSASPWAEILRERADGR